MSKAILRLSTWDLSIFHKLCTRFAGEIAFKRSTLDGPRAILEPATEKGKS